jgi:hypothetical protein
MEISKLKTQSSLKFSLLEPQLTRLQRSNRTPSAQVQMSSPSPADVSPGRTVVCTYIDVVDLGSGVASSGTAATVDCHSAASIAKCPRDLTFAIAPHSSQPMLHNAVTPDTADGVVAASLTYSTCALPTPHARLSGRAVRKAGLEGVPNARRDAVRRRVSRVERNRGKRFAKRRVRRRRIGPRVVMLGVCGGIQYGRHICPGVALLAAFWLVRCRAFDLAAARRNCGERSQAS